MNKEYLYNIYINIFKYIEYRGKQIPTVLDKKEFFELFNANNLVTISTENIIVILTKPGSKYSTFLADSKKKIKDICSNNKVIEELLYICDVNYIGMKTNTSLNLVKKTISELNDSYNNIWFQVRPYKTFELIIPDCIIIPKHKIISSAEAEKMLKMEFKTKSNIPQIYEWDPPLTWLGARAGNYIEIDRYTPSVGIQKIVRYVTI